MYKERFLNEIKFHTAFSKKAVPQPLFQKKRYQKPSIMSLRLFQKKPCQKPFMRLCLCLKKSTKKPCTIALCLTEGFTALWPFQSKYI
jgi:hypothetical protein